MATRKIIALRSGRVATSGVAVQRDRSRVIAHQHRAATERYVVDFGPFLDGDTIRQFVVSPQSVDVVATADLSAGVITVNVTNVVDVVTIQIRCQSSTRREQFSVLLQIHELASDIPVEADFAQVLIVEAAVWPITARFELTHLSPLLAEDSSGGFETLTTEAGDTLLTEDQP